ncbi:transposase [Stieleria sp. TO1_6]|uniref:transposase n=1 Tax=Stieleria tagensis TaxID=2956795 RepID=UPI00209B23BF|nr:transposase [Stieleria tagensis]MCO8121166.1 transposase [Stieleria tagensis]
MDRSADPTLDSNSRRIGGAIHDNLGELGADFMLGEIFDPKAELFINDRLRPHWSQAGAIVFVTFRTKDSIPREVLQRWDREKNDWLDRRELRNGTFWKEALGTLDEETRAEFDRHFNRLREVFLDSCRGACVLKQPRLSKIVADSLLHFDGDRYQMGDFVIMPNHVHLLAAFASEDAMEKQFDSWLHYTARQINKVIGKSGHFWQQEPFDHLVRSPKQYEYLRKYIADNPKKAKLRPGEFHYHQRPN